MTTNQSPLFYFWIIEFTDNTALSQFDPETGMENRGDPAWLPDETKFERPEIFLNKIPKKFGWYPFSRILADKVYKATKIPAMPTGYSAFFVELTPNEKLVAFRNVETTIFDIHMCHHCKAIWQFKPGPVNPRIGLPTSFEAYHESIPVRTEKGLKVIDFISPICPKCGYHDSNAVMMKDKKIRKYRTAKVETFYMIGTKDRLRKIDEGGNISDVDAD